MKTKTWQEIADEIKIDSDINFIGRAISPLHVLGIEAYILYLQELGVTLKGYILAVSHFETGMTLTEDLFHKELYKGIEPVFLGDSGKLKTRIQDLSGALKHTAEKSDFYIVNPYRPEFDFISEISGIRKDNNARVVITDEGNASYVSCPYRIRDNKSPNWGLKGLIRFIGYSSRDRLLYKWFSSKDAISYFLMLEKENGKWVRNRKCSENLIKILESSQIDDDYSSYEDSILICPSLIYEAGILKEPKDIDIYERILHKLGNPKCVVKPHPREKDIEKYNRIDCTIERRYSVTTEVILAHLERKPRCIIGESSTILVSAAALFGIKAISISKLIDKELLSDPAYFDKFNDIFSQVITVPETEEELVSILEEL